MVLHTHSFLHATDRHHLLPSFCGMWAREHVDEPKYCFTPQEGSLTSHTLMQRVWLVRLTRGLVSFLRLSFWTAGVAECALPRPYIHILCQNLSVTQNTSCTLYNSSVVGPYVLLLAGIVVSFTGFPTFTLSW